MYESYEDEGKELWLIQKEWDREPGLNINLNVLKDPNEEKLRIEEINAKVKEACGDEVNVLTEEQLERFVNILD